jgi:ubiquinone/menaquinone biosynthesis C-methylase UbiE
LPRLTTRIVRGADDVRSFFDALATDYRESHGNARRELERRLALIRRLIADVERSCLVEIGCGNGLHLFPLAADFGSLVGIDLSPGMIAAAEAIRRGLAYRERIHFGVGAAERLASVEDGTADAVLCVGALEHMQDKPAVLAQVRRVLRPGGAFICLTPNGDCVWYTRLAPWLGLNTHHLSTDRFLTRADWQALLPAAGLELQTIGYWRFVPAGDMPPGAAALMSALDPVGRALSIASLRGGCYVKALRR